MICPACLHPDTKVIDSRVASDGLSIRRRRECGECSFRFSTYEEAEILDLSVVKRDGHKEAYSREKLIRGLKRSLEKRPVSDERFRKLLNLIERDIQIANRNEVASEEIGRIVMTHLRSTDQVAFIRFASVYRSFQDVAEFQEELDKLSESPSATEQN